MKKIGRALPCYMAMQPAARWPSPWLDNLARPKHGPRDQAMPGPPPRHAAWPGHARSNGRPGNDPIKMNYCVLVTCIYVIIIILVKIIINW